MATIVPDARHPALDVDESERIDYLMVVASMAAADHQTTPEEIERLRQMGAKLAISADGTARVLHAARQPDRVALDEILGRLRASDLRFALMVDAIYLAHTDERIGEAESTEIAALADKLDITPAQMLLVRRYVENYRKRGVDPNAAESAAKLASAGIPVAALAVASAVGAPIATGLGLAAALGISSYMSVKWLFRRVKARRARRASVGQTASKPPGADDVRAAGATAGGDPEA